MVYIGENAVRFTLVSPKDLTGATLEMEFIKPDKTQPANQVALIGDINVAYNKITYPANQVAYIIRATSDFLDTAGKWKVRVIRTEGTEILKSDWINFTVEA